jgi:hypothetical protein
LVSSTCRTRASDSVSAGSARDAGIVDDDVDLTEPVAGGCQQLLPIGRGSDVTPDGERLAQRPGQFDIAARPARSSSVEAATPPLYVGDCRVMPGCLR